MAHKSRRHTARPRKARASTTRTTRATRPAGTKKKTRSRALRCGAVVLVCAGALSLAGTACEALTEDDDNLDATSPFWVEPRGPAARQVRVWQEQGREDDAVVLQRIAKEPVAVWLTGDDPKAQAESVTRQAERSGVIPVLVAYNIPQRDCGQYSSGGAPDATHYRSWAARAAAGIGSRRAWIVLEPDALAQWASGCVPAAAAKQRLALIAQAVRTFKSKPGVSVYIDAGNPGWIRDHNMMVTALTEAGIAEADGFALNVSNFHTTPVTRAYGDHLSALLGGAHYVIDTSRNGNGPLPAPPEGGKKKDDHKKEKEKEKEKKPEEKKEGGKEEDKGQRQPVPSAAEARRAVGTREPGDGAEPEDGEEEHEPESWCNPPGRALGAPPSTATGNPRIDAFLWIKRPGESDGACRGAPPAGRWWAEYALDLARATPSHLMPPSLEAGQPEVPLLPSVLPADPPGGAPADGAQAPAASAPASAPGPAPAPVPAPVPAPATAPKAGSAQGPAPTAPAAPPAGPPTDPPGDKRVPHLPGPGPAEPGHHG
ncbi:glycoside hydrolase family 6 protein [Streptomyces telluris]|uniref:glycoside hydrolase family 6 protein n=1 Tax=Streptomyces telluris TaxID=2720021 RepID=UPI0014393CC8|nr:glycoside hydrolase family 6 protein [Streptomyces telluris]